MSDLRRGCYASYNGKEYAVVDVRDDIVTLKSDNAVDLFSGFERNGNEFLKQVASSEVIMSIWRTLCVCDGIWYLVHKEEGNRVFISTITEEDTKWGRLNGIIPVKKYEEKWLCKSDADFFSDSRPVTVNDKEFISGTLAQCSKYYKRGYFCIYKGIEMRFMPLERAILLVSEAAVDGFALAENMRGECAYSFFFKVVGSSEDIEEFYELKTVARYNGVYYAVVAEEGSFFVIDDNAYISKDDCVLYRQKIPVDFKI